MTAAWKRGLARGVLGLLFSAHFMRRRALAVLSRHYKKGQLVLRYRMGDHTLYLDPADDVIAARVLLRGDWQRRDLERAVAVLEAHLPDLRGKLFVDVGANIGTETVYAMLTGFFSGAIAIEPEPNNFALLKENIAANDLSQRVRAVNGAAGAEPGTQNLVRSVWNKGGHAIGSGGDAIAVEVLPLADILRNAGCGAKDAGLVWIDVNGSETQVLEGMLELLELRVPVVIEHLPALISAEEARGIHRLLSVHYSQFVRIDKPDAEPLPIEKMDPLRDSGDFLFL